MSMIDLQYAVDKLLEERKQMKQYRDYYDGEQPLIYSAERLREVFGSSWLSVYIQNWCSVVVDSTLDRISFQGWDSPDNEAGNEALDDFYQQSDIKRISRLIHKDALITGSGYGIFDNTDEGIKLYRNDPYDVTAVYEDNEPDKIRYAMKIWRERFPEEAIRLNLYYPDVIEKYVSKNSQELPGNFVLDEPMANNFAEIPVIHFQPANIELKNVIKLQNAINKLFADMMVTGEFNAFRQRWIITNSDVQDLKSDPQTVWRIPKGDSMDESTQLGEFQAGDLNMFLQAMDKLANSIAIVSRTPKHYLMNAGSSLSGEALHVMEAPLVKKCQQHIDNFTHSWETVSQFIVEADVVTTWDKVQTDLPVQTSQAMKAEVEMGLPLKTVLRRQGWTEAEIQQYEADKAEEKKTNADLATNALELARIKLASQNDPYSEEEEEVE